MRHKLADILNAWAEGAEIEYKTLNSEWLPLCFKDNVEFRIKPKEPNWWENIPEHGILVKDKEDHKNIILWLQNFCRTDDYIPLTNEEIERFKR